ncbi:glycosyltransferase family 87 protein [Rhodococcus opacus]|uniref:glycosyltransferase family 87 protein n=1 Tax=Rhodococcus opacus TaxID=37919 RepID=UPI0006BB49AA|nr:glycosyltransferase family 87 protein [Rhodococcus opacus]WKN56862.1 glycosyltransferase family 87 protein [Rhodococcus opacus]
MLQSESKFRAYRLHAVALLVGVLSLGAVAYREFDAATGYLMDLSVFRDAGYAFVSGLPLYSADFPSSSGFRFIYAPFAAILFAPMAEIDPAVLQALWCALNLGLVWWMVKVALSKLDVARPELLALLSMGPVLLLEPMRSNFDFGQINIILMALVVADCTGVIPKRFRGVAIGLAAAVKITPAAFLLVLLVRRDFRSIGRSLATILVTVGLGFWLLPQSSVWFWTTEFFATGRAGAPDFFRNQAVTGVIARLGAEGRLASILWVLSAAVIVSAAAWSAYRFTRSGEHLIALSVVALASLLAAPFAVTHHWAYSILLIPILIAPQYRSWRPLIGAATLIFLIGPNFVLQSSSSGWVEAAVREVIGSSQCLIALVLLGAAVVAARSRTPLPDVETDAVPADEDALEPARS